MAPFHCIAYSVEMQELPVFAPNKYFWDKYWDGKDEESKWKVYADAVRQVMAETGGFKLNEAVMDDKLKFKQQVWGTKTKKE